MEAMGVERVMRTATDFLEMAQGLGMIIVNTCFRKREEHRITYRSGPIHKGRVGPSGIGLI